MKILHILLLALLSTMAFGQNYRLVNCYDDKGNIIQPVESEFKEFPPLAQVELKIDQIQLGQKTYTVNAYFKKSIKTETPLVKLNASLAVKLLLMKQTAGGVKQYLYKLMTLKKDKQNNCWRPLSSFFYYPLTRKSNPLAGYGVGYRNKPDYFEIKKGILKVNE